MARKIGTENHCGRCTAIPIGLVQIWVLHLKGFPCQTSKRLAVRSLLQLPTGKCIDFNSKVKLAITIKYQTIHRECKNSNNRIFFNK